MTPDALPSAEELARENEELRHQLREAEELIAAVRTGAVDALAIQGADGPRIFTLEGADQGYRDLIEQMNEGALLLSPEGTVLYCNAALAQVLQHSLEEVLGRRFRDFVPLDFYDYWATLLEKAWEDKARGELPLQARDGTLRPFTVSMNMLIFNGAPALVVLVTDISAQQEIDGIRALVAEQNDLIDRKNQELAQQQQARLAVEQTAAEASRLLEGIPQIAWTATAAGDNSYLNRRWFDFVGEPAVPDASQLYSRIHPDDIEASMASWQQALATEAPLELECRIRDAAGQYRWMLGRALPSRNEQGQVIQWVGTYTDIHEHKLALERIDQAQRQLRDYNKQLLRANADLDNFIYTASHDLKAPISNIEGLLHALLTELPPQAGEGEEVALIMAMMQDSVNRFKRTIEHLTDVSKLQKEHGHPVAVVDLATVVRDVLLDLQPLIEATAGTVEVDVDCCPTISFYEKNLRSIIYNLLSNALKYQMPGRAPQIRIGCQKVGQQALLVVSDNGLGFDVAHRTKLFGMFQRLHDHVEGSGIGLYMVKRIVENAGGRIEVESEVGAGSTFSVYFAQ